MIRKVLLLSLPALAAFSQSNPLYIQFSPSTVKGALYKPDAGPAPHVGVLVAHRTANFLGTLACTELAGRGYLVLCMNPRSDNSEAEVRWEENALDIRSGVEFLRMRPGITKVLLWGHSGGGPTMTFYQAVAENGVSYCQGPGKLIQCGKNLVGLPPADGIILADAHPGNSVNSLRSINPAVTNDAAIVNQNQAPQIDPSLDPFDPKNGYNPKGASTYSEAFKKRYFAAQAKRLNRLIDLATEKLNAIDKGVYRYPDDDVFLVVKGGGGRLMQLDPSIHHGTLKPQKLLRNDGTVVNEIVESVRRPDPSLPATDARFSGGTRLLTIRSFLSANATRAKDSMDEIDWCSSNNSVPCALQSISAPLLIMAMGGHYFIRDNEIHFDLAKSKDKDFVVIEGAVHGFTPCTACEQTPGQYSNSVKNMFDYVGGWIDKRWPSLVP
ncbi:MAG: alpha/beta hydrolase family protein [Bryobacteraceae bacterium]